MPGSAPRPISLHPMTLAFDPVRVLQVVLTSPQCECSSESVPSGIQGGEMAPSCGGAVAVRVALVLR